MPQESSQGSLARPGGALGARTAVLVVLLLTAGGLVLRLTGIGWMLPHIVEPDGMVLVRQVMLMHSRVEAPDQEANWSFYPHLVARLTALLPDAQASPLPGTSLEDHLARAAAPHVQARTLVALLSALIVPGTYLLARRFLERGWSLFAAALATTSLLGIWFAAQSRPHAPAAVFALLAVLAALRLRARPTAGAYVLAGIAAGLAIGALQSGLAVLFPLAAAHLLREREPGRAGGFRIVLSIAFVAALFCAFYPFVARPSDRIYGPMLLLHGGTLEFFGHSVFLGMFNGRGFSILGWSLWSFETMPVVLAAIGLLFWMKRRGLSRDLLVVLAYVVPYVIVVGLYERTYERFALQVLPFVFALAAFGLSRIPGLLPWPRARTAIGCATAIKLMIVPALAAGRLAALRAAPDSATLAARWIEKNLDPEKDRIFLVPFISLPLFQTEGALAADKKIGWSLPWCEHQTRAEPATIAGRRWDMRSWPLANKDAFDAAGADPIRWFASQGARYVVLQAPVTSSVDPYHRRFREVLRAGAKLVYRSPPDATDADGQTTVSFEDLPEPDHVNWTLHLLHPLSAVGWVIEIYRLG